MRLDKEENMKLKGSIAVFAVAAAFAGSAVAGDMGQCLTDIGVTGPIQADGTFKHAVNPANAATPTQDVANETGIWKVISLTQIAGGFLNNKFTSSCLVPKSLKGKGGVDQFQVVTADAGKNLTVDQCSFYQALGSADAKLWVGKTVEAVGDLDTLKTKARNLSDPSVTPKPKLTSDAAKAIGDAVDAALFCIAN